MATANYKVKESNHGEVSILTVVSWDRSFGKCDQRTFSRSGEIFTQSRFRAWCKKYKIKNYRADLEKLPKSVWWQ